MRALAAVFVLLLVVLCSSFAVLACCPAGPRGKPVVNADQTVLILWDAATKTQHFIRKASFKSEADDFGFLVPTPSQPELEESGNEVFDYLLKLTEPETQYVRRPNGGGMGCGCSGDASKSKGDSTPRAALQVKVLEEKLVAGFNAVVLEAKSADALVAWLKEHDYAFSPEVEAWAKPYVEERWKITALKIAKEKDHKETKAVTASALRMSFKTDRPLFPYREPDSTNSASALGATGRLLRIYFVGDARYEGRVTDTVFMGAPVWANPLRKEAQTQLLETLKLPDSAGPATHWLTEFEHQWRYKNAAGDMYFSRDDDQEGVKRPPVVVYYSSLWPTDVTAYALAAFVVVPPLWLRIRRRREARRAIPQRTH